MKTYCVIDASNIMYRSFYAHPKEDDDTVAGIAAHTTLLTLSKYYNQFKGPKMILAFDRSNWRKVYTKSHKCISGKVYKGNRRQNMTPRQKQRYELFIEHCNEFETMIRDKTGVITLANDGLEADDLIAGFVQTIGVQEPDSQIIIVSTDKDLLQLLKHKNVRLLNPATGKDRDLSEWNNDADLFMFEKCIRGDRGDNVQSALPRCRQTRILKAYNDDYERANLMEETWTDHENKEFKVKDLFNENKKLMDLECQPDDIQLKTIKTIVESLNNPGKFSYFHFMKYLGDRDLKKIASQADNFAKILS
jgi:5'-3' exonuclease